MNNALHVDLWSAYELLEQRAYDADEVYTPEEREAYEHSSQLILAIIHDHKLERPPGEIGLREISEGGLYDRREVYQDRNGDYWKWYPKSGWVFGEDVATTDYYAEKRIHKYSPEPSTKHGPYRKAGNDAEEFWDF